jgi:hypothetical protein
VGLHRTEGGGISINLMDHKFFESL